MHQIGFGWFSASAPDQTPLGELTLYSAPPSWILGALLLREGKGKERGGGKKRERRGREGRGPQGLVDTPFSKS